MQTKRSPRTATFFLPRVKSSYVTRQLTHHREIADETGVSLGFIFVVGQRFIFDGGQRVVFVVSRVVIKTEMLITVGVIWCLLFLGLLDFLGRLGFLHTTGLGAAAGHASACTKAADAVLQSTRRAVWIMDMSVEDQNGQRYVAYRCP